MMSMRRVIMDMRKQGLTGEAMQKRIQEERDGGLAVPVSREDCLMALEKVHPSVGDTDLERYQKWMEEFGAT